MCLDLFIYKCILPPTISFFIFHFLIYIIAITCKKLLKDPLSSFNILFKKRAIKTSYKNEL